MRSETAIRLVDVGKVFRQYDSPGERLRDLLFRGRGHGREFRALQSIDLEIKRGHTVGIVGVNGAGKSTLLQLIAGTLTPSTGRIEVHGRISALLELGSGFNPEFTGHENIFFNGQLLGYTREQIAARYDEIVQFADIGEFIHQPVKTYSTGMGVRLAFAVAICHDPDIFIVDEALAVGDEVFQRKCYSRLERMRATGATILFVSHSASSVVQLCDHAILLDRGEVLMQGTPKAVIGSYHKLIYATAENKARLREEIRGGSNGAATPAPTVIEVTEESDETFDPGLKSATLLSYQSLGASIENPHILSSRAVEVNSLQRRADYSYGYRVRFLEDAYNVRFGMMIKTPQGLGLAGSVSSPASQAIEFVRKGSVYEAQFKFKCMLLPGSYLMNAGVLGIVDGTETYLHRLVDALIFRVQPEPLGIATGIADLMIEPLLQQIHDAPAGQC